MDGGAVLDLFEKRIGDRAIDPQAVAPYPEKVIAKFSDLQL